MPTETWWQCQRCGKPVTDGFIQIFNIDETLGRRGAYPIQSSDDPEAVIAENAHEDQAFMTEADLERITTKAVDRIGFNVCCRGCDPFPDGNPYWFTVERADTPEKWLNWIRHLGEKVWMGREDLRHMVEFWWDHKGASSGGLN